MLELFRTLLHNTYLRCLGSVNLKEGGGTFIQWVPWARIVKLEGKELDSILKENAQDFWILSNSQAKPPPDCEDSQPVSLCWENQNLSPGGWVLEFHPRLPLPVPPVPAALRSDCRKGVLGSLGIVCDLGITRDAFCILFPLIFMTSLQGSPPIFQTRKRRRLGAIIARKYGAGIWNQLWLDLVLPHGLCLRNNRN